MQRLQRQVHPRRDYAAAIISFAINHVEGRRGSKIDHDQRTAITFARGEGVDQAVGAKLFRMVDGRLVPH